MRSSLSGVTEILRSRERGEVRAVLELDLPLLEHQPEVRKTAAVAPLLDAHQFGVATPLAGEGDAGDLVGGARREVDIDEAARRDSRFEDLADERDGVLFRRIPLDQRAAVHAGVGLGQGDRRNSEHRALHRAGDGAGIGDVLGDVLARFTPDSTRSGGLSAMIFRTPMMTQSVGVPLTAKWRGLISRRRSGSLSDSECATPDWSLSGATTTTSSLSSAAIVSSTARPAA